MDNAHYYHAVNDEIFDILERAMGRQAKPAGVFKPPTADGTLGKRAAAISPAPAPAADASTAGSLAARPAAEASYVPYDGEFGTAPRPLAETQVRSQAGPHMPPKGRVSSREHDAPLLSSRPQAGENAAYK